MEILTETLQLSIASSLCPGLVNDETIGELFNPENRKISLRSFLSDMKEMGYSDSEIYEVAKVEYPKWRDEKAYVPIARLLKTDNQAPTTQSIEIEFVPQARRGSDLYCTKIWARFQDLKKAVILSPNSFEPASFLTLTSDTANGAEWNLRNIEKNWNKMLTLIRERVGRKVPFVKSVELTKKGHVHIHTLLFNVPYLSKQWLSKTWKRLHGAPIVDIEAVRDLPSVIDYLMKHQQKVLKDSDAMAYFWMHRKRSWSTSQGLFAMVADLVDLISGYLIQSDFEVICSVRLSAVTIDQEKDPPEKVIIHLEREDQERLGQYTEKSLLRLEVSRIVADYFGVPLEWVNRKYEETKYDQRRRETQPRGVQHRDLDDGLDFTGVHAPVKEVEFVDLS